MFCRACTVAAAASAGFKAEPDVTDMLAGKLRTGRVRAMVGSTFSTISSDDDCKIVVGPDSSA